MQIILVLLRNIDYMESCTKLHVIFQTYKSQRVSTSQEHAPKGKVKRQSQKAKAKGEIARMRQLEVKQRGFFRGHIYANRV